MTERDPRISDLWKAADHPEPPAELDQRILAAARQAAARPSLRRRQSWWRLAVPFSATAVLVLAVTLLLRIEREAPERMRDASAPQLAQAPRMAAAEARPEQPPGASAVAPAKAQPERKQSAAGSAQIELDAGQAAPAEVVQADALQPSAAASASRESDRLASQPAAESAAPLQAAPRTEGPELGKAKTARALEAGPEQSVQRIRTLLRAGQREAALQALAELRRRYPDYALPPDLANLP